MRIASIIPNSIVDGPGIRLVVFAQGCSHHCPGCHNPDTHDPEGGYEEQIDNIVDMLNSDPLLSGITLSGGDPFEQTVECAKLAMKVRGIGKSVWTYTGYTYEQIMEHAKTDYTWQLLFEFSNVIVDGPFIQDLRSLELQFRGSSNQRIIDVKKTVEKGEIVLWTPNEELLDKFSVPES